MLELTLPDSMKSIKNFIEPLSPLSSGSITLERCIKFELECRMFMRQAGNAIKAVQDYGKRTVGSREIYNPNDSTKIELRRQVDRLQGWLIDSIEEVRQLQNEMRSIITTSQESKYLKLEREIYAKKVQFAEKLEELLRYQVNNFNECSNGHGYISKSDWSGNYDGRQD